MAEKSIELDSVEIAAAVFGNCDRNIRMLEKEFSVTAVCRGTMLRISGEPANVAAAARAVEGMLLLIENHTPLEDQTVRYCLSLAHDGEEKRVRELTEDFVTVTVKGRPIRPKTLGQKEYLNSIRNNAITFGVGPAGTGKTYLAVAMAVKAFKAKDVSRIVLTRPAVEAGEKLGFLPGDLQQKVDIERILVRSVFTSGGSTRLGTFHLINIHRRSTIKQPLKVHLRQLFLDCIHDVERWFCAIIEDAAQGRCRFSDELREVLLVEVLVLHDLSDSVFHHYV